MSMYQAWRHPIHAEHRCDGHHRQRLASHLAGSSVYSNTSSNHSSPTLSPVFSSRDKHVDNHSGEQLYFCERLNEERRALYNLETIAVSQDHVSRGGSSFPRYSHTSAGHSQQECSSPVWSDKLRKRSSMSNFEEAKEIHRECGASSPRHWMATGQSMVQKARRKIHSSDGSGELSWHRLVMRVDLRGMMGRESAELDDD